MSEQKKHTLQKSRSTKTQFELSRTFMVFASNSIRRTNSLQQYNSTLFKHNDKRTLQLSQIDWTNDIPVHDIVSQLFCQKKTIFDSFYRPHQYLGQHGAPIDHHTIVNNANFIM